MNLKDNFADYTQAEFLKLIHAIEDASTEQARNQLLEHFIQVTEYPAVSDLLYYPEPGADDSAEGITRAIKEWREANGLPGFKDPFS